MLLRRSVLLLVLYLDTRPVNPVNADLRDRAMVAIDRAMVGVITTTTLGTVEVDMAVIVIASPRLRER